MKIELDRDDIIAACTEAINAKFGGKWKTITSDYNWPRSVEFEPAEIAEATLAEEERILAEWQAKEAAEKAGRAAVGIVDQPKEAA